MKTLMHIRVGLRIFFKKFHDRWYETRMHRSSLYSVSPSTELLNIRLLWHYRNLFIIIIIFTQGMVKIWSNSRYYKTSWYDLSLHQQSSHEAELHWRTESTCSTAETLTNRRPIPLRNETAEQFSCRVIPLQLAETCNDFLAQHTSLSYELTASSATAPTYCGVVWTYDSGNGQMTVTSHVSTLSAYHGINIKSSGWFPPDRDRPWGSFVTGMPTEPYTRAITW